MSNNISYLLLALIAGIGIPVMSAMNGTLGARLGSTTAATAILFFGAFIFSLIALSFKGWPSSNNSASAFSNLPFYLYCSGIFVVFYMLSVTWLIPRFGVGNAIFFVLLGQIISASVIDHFGLFNAQVTPLSATRILGISLMVLGLFLSRRI